MKNLLVYIFLVIYFQGYSQKINQIISSLKKNDLLEFVKTGNSTAKNDSTVQFRTFESYQISDTYRCFRYLFDEERVISKKLIKPYYQYKIELVCNKNKIISCIVNNVSIGYEKGVYSYQDKA